MITDEDSLLGFLFYKDLGFSHTLHVFKESINHFPGEILKKTEIISRERRSGKRDKSLRDTPLRVGVLTGSCMVCTGKSTELGRVCTWKVAGPDVLTTRKGRMCCLHDQHNHR